MTTWHEKQSLAARVEELERQLAEVNRKIAHLHMVSPLKLDEPEKDEPKRRGRPPKGQE